MKELVLHEDEYYDKIVLKEPTKVICLGHVHANQIVCEGCNDLIITGDALTVEYDRHGIAIGCDGEFGLSYGRWCLPPGSCKICIDVKEIHCHSKTPGCGIGSYGLYSIKPEDFTENCVIRDTPISMHIVLEKLQGSTKYRLLPEYITEEEYEKRQKTINDSIASNLSFNKAIESLVVIFTAEMEAFATNSGARGLKDVNTYKVVKSFVNKLTRDTYAEGLNRIFASFTKALYAGDYFCPSQYRHIAGNVAYICLAKELKLFDKVAALPLALRYYLIVYDITDNESLEKTDVDRISSFSEISLDDSLIEWYKHPRDLDYSLECKRYFWGENIYTPDNREVYNALVKPDVRVEGESLVSDNLYLVPRLRWGYSGVSLNYRGFTEDISVLKYDKSCKLLTLSTIPKDCLDKQMSDIILVGFKSVLSDIFESFK